jgi:hypothetical protein
MAVELTIFVCLLSACTYSQVAERRLEELYSRTSDGAFIVGPSVRAYAAFNQHHKACAFTVRGPISEAQVLRYFDLLVPENTRGRKQAGEPFWCVNVCEHVIVYQNVTLTTAVTLNQTSDPAAIITYNRSDCKAAVAEAEKAVLQIKKR